MCLWGIQPPSLGFRCHILKIRIPDPETYDALPAKLNKHPVSVDPAPGELGSLCPSGLNGSLDDPAQSWSNRNLLHGLGHSLHSSMHSLHRRLSPGLVPGTVLAPWDTRATHSVCPYRDDEHNKKSVCGSWRSAFWRKIQRGGESEGEGQVSREGFRAHISKCTGLEEATESRGKAQVWLEQNG